jgi:hypothetical protein
MYTVNCPFITPPVPQNSRYFYTDCSNVAIVRGNAKYIVKK